MTGTEEHTDAHSNSNAKKTESLWNSRFSGHKPQVSTLLLISSLITAGLLFVFSLPADYLQDNLLDYLPLKSKTSTAGFGTNEQKSGDFELFVGVLHDPIQQGTVQVATITAYNTMDGSWFEGAPIKGSISKGRQIILTFEGVTDSKGRTAYSWEVDSTFEPGLYILQAEASVRGQSAPAEPLYFLVEAARAS